MAHVLLEEVERRIRFEVANVVPPVSTSCGIITWQFGSNTAVQLKRVVGGTIVRLVNPAGVLNKPNQIDTTRFPTDTDQSLVYVNIFGGGSVTLEASGFEEDLNVA